MELALIIIILLIFLNTILFITIDLNYFLRMVLVILQGFFTKKVKIMDETYIYGICTTTDLTLGTRHINNARYLREVDFAHRHYLNVTGLFSTVKSRKGIFLVAASSIRYRRSILLFQSYKVFTKLIWWDLNALYFEDKFVTSDGFVRAVVLEKVFVKNVNVDELLKPFSDGDNDLKVMREDLELWMKSLESTSKSLRK